MMAADAPPARRRPPGGKKRRACLAAMLTTSAVCACLAVRRWGGSGSGSGERSPLPPPPPPPMRRAQKEAAREGNASASAGSGLAAAGSEGRGAREGEARKRGWGATATRLATSLATTSDNFLLRPAASKGGGANTRSSGSSAVGTPRDTTADSGSLLSLRGEAPPGEAAAAAEAPPSSILERERKSRSTGGIVRRAPRDHSPDKVDAGAMAVRARGGDDPTGLSTSATAAAAAAAAAATADARQRGAAPSLRASTGGHPTEFKVEEVIDGGARRRLRRSRRLQSGSESGPLASGGQEKEEEETAEVYDQDADGAEGAFGSVGLWAFLICFGLLFCVMEVAKCYFLVECRRRQRWRRQRAQGHMHEGQMPIASSRVVAPEIPVAGAKDSWVDVVVHEVSLSAENRGDGDVKIPSAPGYAVAGASHALQEAIEHARRLSPGRGYRAVFASPARPEQQQRQQQRRRRQEEREEEQVGASLEISGISPSPDLSEVHSRSAAPAAATATATVTADGGLATYTPAR